MHRDEEDETASANEDEPESVNEDEPESGNDEDEADTDEEEEVEEEEEDTTSGKYDLWNNLYEQAWTTALEEAYEEEKGSFIEKGLSEDAARKSAFKMILPALRQSITSNYVKQLLLCSNMKKDPGHKKIMATKRKLVEEENYGEDEALRYALKKRKYLIQEKTGTLSDDDPPDVDEDDGTKEDENVVAV